MIISGNIRKKRLPPGFRPPIPRAAGVAYKVLRPGVGSEMGEEELQAVADVLKGDTLTMGLPTQDFEQEFAEFTGTRYAFALSNGTGALHLATWLLGLGSGDEVITTPITYIATQQPLIAMRANVIFADVDLQTYNIDPRDVERKISPKTKAIYLVHEAGHPCDMDPIMALARDRGLAVVEDAARANGARYKGRRVGGIGDLGCFSFQTLKNMTTLGEGGALTTNQEDLAEWLPQLRHMGTVSKVEMEAPPEDGYDQDFITVNGQVGMNLRMSDAQAAVGRVQLRKLDQLNARRAVVADRLTRGLRDIKGIHPPYVDPKVESAWYQYLPTLDEEVLWPGAKWEFLHRLNTEYGIQAYAGSKPTYKFTVFREMGYRQDMCPVAEAAYRTFAGLPIGPRITEQQVDYMVESIGHLLADMRGKRSRTLAAGSAEDPERSPRA